MFVSLLKYKKPSFAYLYTLFGISLIILVVFSLLFYSRLNALIRYSDDADKVHNTILQFEKLESCVKDGENAGRGFILTKDSSFLEQSEEFNALIYPTIDSLRKLLKDDPRLTHRVNKLYRLINKRLFLQKLNMQKVALQDTIRLRSSLNEGEYYMNQFRNEIQALQQEGVAKSARLVKSKNFYEIITPEYFNVILLFSGLITVVAFYYINRQIKIRLKYQKELETRLQELNRSYAELEQFTFVASHDLQEPLRKIRTFSDRLLSNYSSDLVPKARYIIERMDLSAARLQDLIQEIGNFSRLINQEESSGIVDLNKVLEKVLKNLDMKMVQGGVEVRKDQLPFIEGYSGQLELLLAAILDNAIKFSSTTRKPLVSIRYFYEEKDKSNKISAGGKYHRITIEDNGIGFDDEFAEKIFMIFQRLHSQQSKYHGMGIGLAIAKRVMVNHNGFIEAHGTPGEGAAFSLYFPFQNTD